MATPSPACWNSTSDFFRYRWSLSTSTSSLSTPFVSCVCVLLPLPVQFRINVVLSAITSGPRHCIISVIDAVVAGTEKFAEVTRMKRGTVRRWHLVVTCSMPEILRLEMCDRNDANWLLITMMFTWPKVPFVLQCFDAVGLASESASVAVKMSRSNDSQKFSSEYLPNPRQRWKIIIIIVC